jgi:hypothetical protein
MKKLLTVLALVASAAASFGQGTITFQNSGLIFGDLPGVPAPDRRVYLGSVANGTLLVGTNYAAQLWYDTGTGMRPLQEATKIFRIPTTTQPGTWNTAPTAVATFPDLAVGGTAQLEVRVWDIQRFATFAAAVAGGGETGRSQPFSYLVPPAGSAPADYTLKGLRAFAVVPEPSVIALGVLGLGSLLLFRRKKA